MPFIYPTSIEMREIEPDLIARGMAGRIGLEIMPPRNVNAAKVRWSQKDNYYGLQQMRGLDGAPNRVVRVGMKTYEYEPGVFGEYIKVDETELTTRAASIDINAVPIDIGDLVAEADDLLVGRELDRMESSVWTLLGTGTISIKIDNPLTGTQIGYSDTYAIQQYTAQIPWGTLATAAPLSNFQSVQQLQVGHSIDLGAGAKAYANQVTINRFLNNQNANDFGGRRSQFGATLNALPAFNSYMQAQNLPQLIPYDAGYLPKLGASAAQFVKFIPNGKVIVVGKRVTGAVVGNYILSRNAANGFRPGSYRKVLDRFNGSNAEMRVPPDIEIHRGHNGGPAIYYPSAIVVMNV